MSIPQQSAILGSRITRRSALQGATALGLGAAINLRGLPATAQDATLPELMITAVDFAFEMPASIEAGHVQVTMDNQGMHDHHAMFMRPMEGSTLEDVQASLEEPGFDALLAVSVAAGGPSAGPGESSTVVMNLEPGQYLVICAIPDDEGVPHFALGMQTPLEVIEATTESTAPEAVATVTLVDMAFEGLPEEVAAGSHVWEIVNEGPSVHEIAVFSLPEGVTYDMVHSQMMAPMEASPVSTPVEAAEVEASPEMSDSPPFFGVNATAPMSADNTNWLMLDLEAGEYFAICFVPDFATGTPHYALGMMAPFTVT